MIPCYNSRAADQYAHEQGRLDQLEDEATRACEALNQLAAPLYSAVDRKIEDEIRGVLYDAIMNEIINRKPRYRRTRS